MFGRLKYRLYTLLRKSERFFKTDMVYLAKGGFWVTLGQISNTLLSLGVIVAFANLLPKETYGVYRYILSLAGILNIFTLTGMNSAVAQAVARGNESVLHSSVAYQLKWNLAMAAAFFALAGYYLFEGNSILALSFLILGAFVPPTLALNTYGAYLEGKKRFHVASILSIASTFVYTVGILAAIIFSGEIVWIVAAYAITTFAATGISYWYATKDRGERSQPTNDAISYGRTLSFIRLMGPIVAQIDKIILAQFWGATQLAIYAIAMAVPERASGLMKTWVGIGFPKFSEKTPKEINTVFYKRIFQGVAVGGAASALYILLSPLLFIYVLPQYAEGIFYSQVLSLGFILAIPNRYISLLLESQRMARTIFTNGLVQNILKILLYVVLGIWGGILGLVIAHVANSIIGFFINIAAWRIGVKKKTT